jgi:hypothetical protein
MFLPLYYHAAEGSLEPSPCGYGHIVPGHACYCSHPESVSKCPIWKKYGLDPEKWNFSGDWDEEGWESGCKYFVPYPLDI